MMLAICPCSVAYEYEKPRKEIDRTMLLEHLPARIIELSSICNYQNLSNQNISRFYHRVTIPPSFNHYQILLDVKGNNLEKATLGKHKNGIDKFISFSFPIPAKSSVSQKVSFRILLLPVDFLKTRQSVTNLKLTQEEIKYTKPSQYIESEANPIKRIAQRFKHQADDNIISQTMLAYEFPAKNLKFKPQDPIGALAALKTGQGDCTEYSALCIALCRAQGIPARQTGVFHIRKKKEIFQQPNHNSSEVFLGDIGWVPIDANLGRGKYEGEYAFGKTGNSVILLKREGAWVWSNYLPKSGYDMTKAKPSLASKMTWLTKIIEEGSAKSLIKKHYSSIDE